MSFAKNLKLIRKENNITQEELAEMLEVSRQAVSKWESGSGYPEVEKLQLISKKLKVSLDYLLLDKERKESENNYKEKIIIPTGVISIKSYDNKKIISCRKVKASKVMWPRKNEPKYLLIGIEKTGFWGGEVSQLGWYSSEEDITKEIEEISEAIISGIPIYELKYFTKIENEGLSIKIVE